MTNKNKVVPETEKKKIEEKFNTPLNKDPKEKVSKPNWAARLLLILIIFIGGMATAVYFMPVLKDRLPFLSTWIGDAPNNDLGPLNEKALTQQTSINDLLQKTSELELRLNQLSNNDTSDILLRIERLEQNNATPSETIISSEDTSQSARIDMLLSRLSQLEVAFVPLSQNLIDAQNAAKERLTLQEGGQNNSSKISTLESRLLKLEVFAAKDNSTILLNVTLAELRRKIVSGKSYVTELLKIKEMTDDRYTKSLEYLSTNASTGIQTPGQLQSRFNDLIPDLLSATTISSDATWWQDTLNSLLNIISIRKTDGSSYADQGIDPTIAEIESWLRRFDLNSALEALSSLPIAIQEILEEWKSDVEIWLYSENALSDLETISSDTSINTEIQSPTVEAQL